MQTKNVTGYLTHMVTGSSAVTLRNTPDCKFYAELTDGARVCYTTQCYITVGNALLELDMWCRQQMQTAGI